MPKYTIPRPRQPDTIAEGPHFDGNWLCTGCHKPLLPGQAVRQQALYKVGALDSIEVGHAECVPDFDNADIPEDE